MVYIAPYYYSLAGMADPGKQGSGWLPIPHYTSWCNFLHIDTLCG
jgi:hypothetical protein